MNFSITHFCIRTTLALALLFTSVVSAQTIVSDNITSNTTWSPAGNPYILDGYIFVTGGATLTIEGGVVIRGLDDDPANNILPDGTDLGPVTDDDENVGALICTRTGRIVTSGSSAQNPIIFTAVSDNLEDPDDLTCADFGLWGGLIVLGNATVSSPEENRTAEGFVENIIEGIVTQNPSTEALSRFGGTDDNDDRGVYRYISIRHGGDVLTDGDEINGFTLGGVGRGTVVEFIDVIANADDGIEFFGGTVDMKNAIVTCVVDDSYDYDQGFRGRGQFWVAIGEGNRLGEHDGGDDPDEAEPFSTPVVYNASYFGKPATASSDENELIVFRDNAGGTYSNSIFCPGFEDAIGFEVEYRFDRPSSFFQFSTVINDPVLGAIQALSFEGNVWCQLVEPLISLDVQDGGFTGSTQQNRALSNANNTIGDIDADNVRATPFSTIPNALPSVTVRPDAVSEVTSGLAPFISNSDGFFQSVDYKGAIDPNGSAQGWLEGWTAPSEYGLVQ